MFQLVEIFAESVMFNSLQCSFPTLLLLDEASEKVKQCITSNFFF